MQTIMACSYAARVSEASNTNILLWGKVLQTTGESKLNCDPITAIDANSQKSQVQTLYNGKGVNAPLVINEEGYAQLYR